MRLIKKLLVDRFSRERPRFTDTLDMIKFLCKDMWTLVFRKQIDNLKTNHRVCVLLRLRLCSIWWLIRKTGRLRPYRQWLQTLYTNEHGNFLRSGSKGPTGQYMSRIFTCRDDFADIKVSTFGFLAAL